MSDPVLWRLAFVVPGPPVPNARARVTSRGTFTPARTRAYRNVVAVAALEAASRCDLHPSTLHDGPVLLKLEARFPLPAQRRSWGDRKPGGLHAQKPDLDNVAKGIMDALTGLLWKDDAQVARLVVDKRWVETPGEACCWVTVEAL